MSQFNEQNSLQEPAFTPFKVRVLLIDDQLIIAEALRRMLGDEPDIEFHYITDAHLAVQSAIQLKPTVILQDLVMPLVDGFDLLRQYRSNASTKNIPVIMLSTKEEPALKVKGFACGANDYLVKLPDKRELIARIRYHSGAYISVLQRDDAFRFLRESQQKLAEANIELQKLATLDGLTGIGNRRQFDDLFHIEWLRGAREKRIMSLLLCDIDFFKGYNDEHGHQAGDLCLKKVASVLIGSLRRPADVAARYGGEEFVIILPDTNNEGALIVAETCRRNVENLNIPNPRSKTSEIVTLSIGVATMVPTTTMGSDILIENADKSLYEAKGKGRNCVVSLS